MANYDFQNLLSPFDFEHLVRDLLSRHLGVELSAFSEGRDHGVDLRCSKNVASDIIVQCKRTNLINDSMLNKEKEKIKKISPLKYYFVTSCDISPEKTDKIKNIFKDWMESDENIFTKNKLNNLLDKYPDILRKNYKLWLNSSEIFDTIINKNLYERSRALVNDIKESSKFYVKNESFDKSIKILNESRFLIISGTPGIGKTTLAKLLLLEYLQQNIEVIEIRNISEGEKMLV